MVVLQLDFFFKHMAYSETALFACGLFAFNTPSAPLSIKTQKTNNGKDLKPQSRTCYLG